MFLACLLALAITGIFSVLLFFGFIGAIGALTGPSAKPVADNSVLEITLHESISDKPQPFTVSDLYSLNFSESLSLYEVIDNIGKAKDDPRIKGIFLNITPVFSMGIANMDEIREALADFKRSGKFIASYSDTYSQGSYYLSSVADWIIMNPLGEVMWQGMSSTTPFFKGALDKLGIQPEVIRHGKFKSAVEPFISESMSAENREQVQTFIGSVWHYIVSNVAKARLIDSTLLQDYASQLTIRDADIALEKKFIDQIGYRDNAVQYIHEKLSSSDDPKFVSLKDYIGSNRMTSSANISKNKIAVIYAEGDIVEGKGSQGQIGGDRLAAAIEKARKDDKVKAIVLRVNSPGGSALASETIWRAASLAQQEKPLIVSMGNYAASGGYYISCPADVILANPATITGSIGVFGLLFNVQRGLNDKLGINTETVRTNPSAGAGAILFEPLTLSQRAYLQHTVERIYTTFVQHVADGRFLTVEKVDAIGQGRVWSGVDAKGNGLVDGFGGLKDAVLLAAEKADISEDFHVVAYPQAETKLEQILSMLNSEVKMKLFKGKTGEIYQASERFIESLEERSAFQSVMPYRVDM